MNPGTKVIKNPDTWVPTEFDGWGRGEGVGTIVEPNVELGDNEVDIRWPAGRCVERIEELIVTEKF